jgi:hypothetical protein
MNSDPVNPNILATRIRDGKTDGSRRVPIDCGHFDMRIGRDGTWYYRGSAIQRKPLVTLFSSVLKRDGDGQFWLETPVERGRIDVDDAPFVAVALDVSGSGDAQTLTFHTNLDETVTADADHPIRVDTNPQTGEPSPYVHIRDRLEALIARPVYYQLADLAVSRQGDDALGVWSSGQFFVLGHAGDDDDSQAG